MIPVCLKTLQAENALRTIKNWHEFLGKIKRNFSF